MNQRKKIEIIAEICNDFLLNKKTPKHPELTAEEWRDLLCTASIHGMLPIVVQAYSKEDMCNAATRKVLLAWYASVMENEHNYKQRFKTMRYMAKMFAKEGLDIMFLKGAALAQMYSKPELRTFSDIDYYLYGQSQRGIKVMEGKGISSSAYYHHHTQASFNGILLENHYDFVERVNHRCDLMIDDALKALAESEGHTVKAGFLGEDIHNAYLMTPTMNAIFLMRHMSAHFVGESIPLRMLYDWVLFLKQYSAEVDWQMVEKLYYESGMAAFAGVIQRLIQVHLGVDNMVGKSFPVQDKYVERIWDSIVCPPRQDPYRKFSLRYYIYEAYVFFGNRWKHQLVYPGESFALLFCKYTWLGIKKMLGILKIKN